MYKKIFKSLNIIALLALVLTAVFMFTINTFTTGQATKSEWMPIIIILAFIYIFLRIIARAITKSIIKPINDIDLTKESYENIYPELIPFIKRISVQSREIIWQAERVNRQKARLQTVSENMTEGFILLDRDKNITAINKAAQEIFHSTDNGVFYPNLSELSDNKDVIQVAENAFNGKKTTKTVNIDGTYYKIFANPINEKNTLIGVVMLVVDETEDMKAEIMRKEFSANVSHELKTPLTTILGYSQLINNGIAQEADIIEFTRKIEKESSRLLSLIEDIIKLSKLDETKTDDIEKEDINLDDVIYDVIDSLKDKAKEKNITIVFTPSNAHIKAIRGQITELIYNLCDNGIKYNTENGTLKIKATDSYLTISDTGIGIPENDIPRIFERFYRVDKSRSKKVNGTGLGLSIVKHICMQNNFEISVESEIDKGSEFKIEF